MPSAHAETDGSTMRFGVNMLTPGSRAEWQDRCRRAEALGYDVISVADHLGMPAPFPALVSAAEATSRPRLSVFVLNTAFYTPVLLARDLASTDQLTEGRLDAALGAGYAKAEFDAANLHFPTPRERVDHLERTAIEVRQLLADSRHAPRPTQSQIPLTVAGHGDRVLRFAARYADTVALSGSAPGSQPGLHRLASRNELGERLEYVALHAGERSSRPELNLLIHAVAFDGTRREVARRLRRFEDTLTEEALADVPTLLVGAPTQLSQEIEKIRALGISYLTVPEQAMESFAVVMRLWRNDYPRADK